MYTYIDVSFEDLRIFTKDGIKLFTKIFLGLMNIGIKGINVLLIPFFYTVHLT